MMGQDSHSLKPLSQPCEPSSYHNPIQIWVEQACGDTSWHDFVPPPHPHEFDFMFFYPVMIIPAHDYFVLDIFLFWFVIKHKGRTLGFDEMLGWIH
jgi:hypothetical protein